MGSTSLTAANVMDSVASLMNDTAKSSYTYIAQIPYLNMALAELQEHFQLNNIPVTNETSADIAVPAGTTEIGPVDGFGSGITPTYPTDLVEIQSIYEKSDGADDDQFTFMSRWRWEAQRIKFLETQQDREFRLNYIQTIFPKVNTSTDVIGVINCESYLFYKTAALCAHFIGENKTRSDELNALAIDARDRVTGIGTKGRQNKNVRRRPLMATYKRRSAY